MLDFKLQIDKEDFKDTDEVAIATANIVLEEWSKSSGHLGSLPWFFDEVVYPMGETEGQRFLKESFYPSLLGARVQNVQNGAVSYPEEFKFTWYSHYCRFYSADADAHHMAKVKDAIEKMGYGQPVALLNTSIPTAKGEYSYTPLSIEGAQAITASLPVLSAIGHQSTADIVCELLGEDVEVNRIKFEQGVNQRAIVFKLNGRPEEGKILNREEIESIGYEFGLLIRTK